MNEHILITPSGMDCQCTTVLLSTNLMLLSTVRRERAFIYCREFEQTDHFGFWSIVPITERSSNKRKELWCTTCSWKVIASLLFLLKKKKSLSFIIYIKHSLCSQKPKFSMHLGLYMFYYIYTECSIHCLNSFQVCKWYLGWGWTPTGKLKKIKPRKTMKSVWK